MINESVNHTTLDFRIKTRAATNYTMNTHHFHDAYEIFYMNSGSRDYFINDATYRVHQGDLVLIKPHDLHKTIDTGEAHSRILISFRPTFLPFINFQQAIDQCFDQSRVLKFDFDTQSKIEDHLRRLAKIATDKETYFEALLQCELASLLVDITHYIEDHIPTEDSTSSVNEKTSEVIQYLRSHYTQTITLDKLAEDFFISRYYLTRVFKRATGFTIFEYIHSLRIREAQRLLKQTNLKVIDVAQKVGFSNVSNFGKVFKSITGQSPLHYRKSGQSNYASRE